MMALHVNANNKKENSFQSCHLHIFFATLPDHIQWNWSDDKQSLLRTNIAFTATIRENEMRSISTAYYSMNSIGIKGIIAICYVAFVDGVVGGK